ncbi:MAG: TonB-dependent receptor [Gemmatimonadaceae bacterium]|nr:TonB-dependent receptor [Gemmatimonadaceae bacterium]
MRDANGPLAAAQLSATDPSGRLVTGQSSATGRFVLRVAGGGQYTVVARTLGYLPAVRTVRVPQGEAALEIRLERARQLQAVQVVGASTVGTPLHPGADALAGSVSVLSGEQLARENVAVSQELLRKMPGVYRAEFNQGVISGDIGIRGFNTESEIGSTKLLIDGIPSNLNSGVTEMNALFPLEIGRMEVVRGTHDPRFGLFNLAGNVSVETQRASTNFLTSRLQTGSFGTTEAQVLTGAVRGGFSQTVFAGVRRSNGYRDNAGHDRWSASGKWFYTSDSARLRVGVIARAHRLDTDAPGYLTLAQSRTAPTFSPTFSATDGGTIDTDHGSVHLEARPTSTISWSLRGYTQRFDRVRYVRFTAAGAQQERIEDERQTGAISALTWSPARWTAQAVRFTVGADVQQQTNEQFRFRTVERARQATLRNHDFTLDNAGGYVQLQGAPVSWLSFSTGLRLDRFSGAFVNNGTTPTAIPVETPLIAYGWIPQPKANVTARLSDEVSAYANYGRGFQIGAGLAGYSRAPLNPSRNDGGEVGVVLTPSAGTSIRAGYWQQHASDEVRLKFDNSGDSENIGRTKRAGLDVEGTWRLPHAVQLWAAGTTQRAVLVEPGRAQAALAGNLLNHVPAWTTKYGAEWSPRVGATLAAWAYAQGRYHLTPANDRREWGAQHTVNVDASWRWKAAALGVGVTNLFNRYVEYVWWDGAQTLHSPAARRALFLTLTLDR